MLLSKKHKNQYEVEQQLNAVIQEYKVEKTLSVGQARQWVAEEDGPPQAAYNHFIQRAFEPFQHIEDIKDAQKIIAALNDAWKFFPHNSLNGKTPLETMKEEHVSDPKNDQPLFNPSSSLPTDLIEQAWHTIRWQREGIPWEALRLLRKQPTTLLLLHQLADGLNHAYDDTYVDDNDGYYYPAPLWYGVVAETHLDLILIDPVIQLFTTTDNDWDFLNEEGQFLLGALAEKYPERVIPKVMNVIEHLIDEGSTMPYLFLYDALKFTNPKANKEWFLRNLAKDSHWRTMLLDTVVTLQIKEAIPIIQEIVGKKKAESKHATSPFDEARHLVIEAEAALKELAADEVTYPHLRQPLYLQRKPWEQHFKKCEDRFYDNADDADTEEITHNPFREVGRNDTCPCGSGKKFKRCCLQ